MWAAHCGINNKKVFLILTLFSDASNLMVNKNTVSLGVKLLIKPPFKIFPLQFFSQCFPSKLQLLLLIYLFMYLFSLRFRGFFLSWRGRVFFSIFHLSHLVEFNALISSLWYGVQRFRNNCQVQIKKWVEWVLYWTTEHKPRLERWIWHPIFLPSTSSFAFVSSRGFSL